MARQPVADDVHPESVLTEDEQIGQENLRRAVSSRTTIETITVLSIYALDDIQQNRGSYQRIGIDGSLNPHLHPPGSFGIPARNPRLPVLGVKVVHMKLGIGLEIRSDGLLKASAELDVRLNVRALKIFHAEGQTHGVRLHFGDVNQGAARVREGPQKLRAPEHDAIRTAFLCRRPRILIAVMCAAALSQFDVTGARLLNHQAFANVDVSGRDTLLFQRLDEPLDHVRVSDNGVMEYRILGCREIGFDGELLGQFNAGSLSQGENAPCQLKGLSPLAHGVILRWHTGLTDENGLGMRVNEGMQAEESRSGSFAGHDVRSRPCPRSKAEPRHAPKEGSSIHSHRPPLRTLELTLLPHIVLASAPIQSNTRLRSRNHHLMTGGKGFR